MWPRLLMRAGIHPFRTDRVPAMLGQVLGIGEETGQGLGLDLEEIVVDGRRMGDLGEGQPGVFTSLESGPKAEDGQYSRPEVMDAGGACGNAGEEVTARAVLAWGQERGREGTDMLSLSDGQK